MKARSGGTRFYVARWMAAGAAFGAALVLIAWRVAVATSGPLTYAELHQVHPIMWIVDLLPSVMGVAGGAIGHLHRRLNEQQRHVEQIARQIAAAWTSELHEANGELVKAMEDRQRYYSVLSHELRTPLSSILGYSELAEDIDIQPPELSDYMAEIYGSARSLLVMVNDLLDAAKLELGGVVMTLDEVDGDEIAHQAAQTVAPLAAQKNLVIETDLQLAGPVRADPTRLRQVLVNLLSNAVKYSERGVITIRSGLTEDATGYISVEDQGAGIAASDLERIFRPFEQTDAGAGRSDSTGLGLTICRAFVEAMGGSVGVDSPGPGKGSTFRVLLPVGVGSPPETRTAFLATAPA